MVLKFSNLKWNRIKIGHPIHRRGKREIDTPKTKNSFRTLKLSFSMMFKIFILKCFYIKNYGDSDYDYFIFGGKSPLSPTSIKRYKHKACESRNIREIKTHDFHHSYATRMVKRLPIEVLSKRLGIVAFL